MADDFAKSVLRVAIAQMCQNVGWNAIQSTPLELLVDILHRYLEELGKTTHRYCEQFGRTEPNLDDLGLAFKDIGVPLGELEDFVNNVEPLPFVHEVPKFPLPRPNDLQFPNQDSREVQTRPEWINEHLPLMYPEAEEEYGSPNATTSQDGSARRDSTGGSEVQTLGDGTRMKRPLDIESLMQTPKRARLYSDDEGQPMREVTSVFMSSAGVISPVREGRLPEAKTPSKFLEDSRPSSPEPLPVPVEVKKEGKKETKKEIKVKEVKKEEKKVKEKKEKSKEVKKKSARKDKDKKENKDKKKEKNRDKNKAPKVSKDNATKISLEGFAAKMADMKAKAKSKLPKQKPNKLFYAKPKHKEKPGDLTKLFKEKSKKKAMKTGVPKVTLTARPKSPKAPRGKKLSIQAKIKVEKLPPVNQVAPLIIRPTVKEKKEAVVEVKHEKEVVEIADCKAKSPSRVETLSLPSGEDSPERLVIDDNPETLERQERESRMAALNESIDAAIQRGIEESEKQQEEATKGIDETIEDVIRQGVFESHVKLEPRDVYDFTDDESSPPATPVTPRTPEAVTSPTKKKPKKESNEGGGRKVKDKIKEKIKQKTKETTPKGKTKSPLKSLFNVDLPADEADERPKTPDAASRTPSTSDQESPVSFQVPFPHLPGLSQFSQLPYFAQISQVPPALLPYPPPTIPPLPPQFQSHTPPNMPMPPMGFYVRNPKPDAAAGYKGSLISPGHLQPTSFSFPGSNGAEEPVKTKPDEPEKVKAKEHKREKREKTKDKDRDKDPSDKDGDKGKTKKKKEKAKDKEKKKQQQQQPSDPETKESKGKSSKTKEKEKPPKSKEKSKDKSKSEKKEKKKKEEKAKAEEALDSTSGGSSIPRITLKLGNTAATEGTKIVIKNVTPRDATQSSSSPSPPPKEVPPPSPSPPPKSHPKPQSKVNPVPPAPKATTASNAPARTVITETIGTIIDEQGNKIWICPACTRPDDGSPMIGCDECDDWYHWVCVGIVVPPKEEENWFCKRCIGKKKQTLQKKKKKKHRKDKPN